MEKCGHKAESRVTIPVSQIMIDWKYTDEEMPKEDEEVLIFIERYGYICSGYFDGESWLLNEGDDTGESMYPVTAWAELNIPKNRTK